MYSDSDLSAYTQSFTQGLPQIKKDHLFALGKNLFFDKKLSGNKNVSCSSCHQVEFGGAEGLPLGIGQGADFVRRKQSNGKLLTRSSPSIFDLGSGSVQKYFWDSRVSATKHDGSDVIFNTPFAGLNGVNPKNYYIYRELKNFLAAQVLFPLINPDEMLGEKGENDISKYVDPPKIWSKLTSRITKSKEYQTLLQKAYPRTQINIGHLANAIAHFITKAFDTSNTRYDQMTRGQIKLTSQEQRGLAVFTKNCSTCHALPVTTTQTMINIAVPSINTLDGDQDPGFRKFKFKMPSLKNIALTAPYMHNGAYATLEEVIDHYINPEESLRNYDISRLNKVYGKHYNRPLKWVDTEDSIDYKLKNIDFRVLNISMNKEEKKDLLYFLRNTLTDQSYLLRINMN